MEAHLQEVTFAYGDREVLALPDLRFAEGRVTALLGPNGAGKSTVLRLLAGLERPRSGRVLVGGSPAAAARASIAYAFQEAVFLSGSLRANLALALRLRGLPRPDRSRRLEEAAAACGVAHLLDRSATRLSGGEAQRANLARALSLRAPLTLLDEPLAGFDEGGRRQMLAELPALLRRFAATTVLVTHDRDEALRLADDLALLRGGRVQACGPKGAVFAAPPDAESAAFLGYTLLSTDAGLVGVAPGGLRPGPGDLTLTLHVEALTDLVTAVEVSGVCSSSGDALTVAFPPTPPLPAPGDQITVGAPTEQVVSFAEKAAPPVDSPSRSPVA